VKRSEIFTTAADLQTSVTVHVFQGERPMSADNVSLGEFNLDGLPPAPRGVPKIEIAFDIDSNGILDVAAKDLATGKARSIRITGSTRLPEEEKKRMIQEAERYAEQDKKRREEADKLNVAEATSYQAEKTLADFGPKLPEDLRRRIESALRETREACSKRDATLATERAESLKLVLQEAGKKLYEEAPREKPQATPSEAGAPGTRVVDAEYTEAQKSS
jgi:molecular chaperone DnaK